MSEITESIQILRLGFDGLRFGMDVTGATVKQIKDLTIFIVGLLHREKLKGKTSLKQMLKKNGSLQVLKIKEEDYKKLKKLLKKYGVLYSVLPDINKKDGMCEILFHTESTPRINEIVEKLQSGKVESLVDYAQNGKDGNYQKIVEEFKKDNLIPKETLEISKEEIKEVSREINRNAMAKDTNKVCLIASKTLIADKREGYTRIVVPRTKGEYFLEIRNEDLVLSKSKNSYFVFLDSKKDYPIEDRSGKVVKQLTGAEIKQNYFFENELTRNKALKDRNRSRKRNQNQQKNNKKQSVSKKQVTKKPKRTYKPSVHKSR